MIRKRQKSKCALENLWSHPKAHEDVHLATQQCNEIEENKQTLQAWRTTNQAVLDSCTASFFMQPQDGATPTGEPSKKIVGMPDGTIIQATKKAILPMTQLSKEARQYDILPCLQHNSLVSVGKLADAGYYTIFMPGGKGVQVFDENKSNVTVTGDAVLRGWRDSHGLWRVPVGDDSNADISLTRKELNESLHNVFDLPSIKNTIRYMHTSIGFPTRRTWVKAIQLGNFIGWSLVTVKNVNK